MAIAPRVVAGHHWKEPGKSLQAPSETSEVNEAFVVNVGLESPGQVLQQIVVDTT